MKNIFIPKKEPVQDFFRNWNLSNWIACLHFSTSYENTTCFVLLIIAKWVVVSYTGSPFQIDKESHRINKGLLLAIIILPIFIGCIMIYSVCTWLYRKAYNSAPSSSQPHAFKWNLDPDTSSWYHHVKTPIFHKKLKFLS